MIAKRHRNKRGISFFSKKEENYENNIRDDINPDQANNKYPLHL